MQRSLQHHKVKFKLLSTEKTGAGGKNLDPKKTEGYEGIFIEDNLIRAWGQVDKKHWKIRLRSKVKGKHSYDASFKFCMNRNECYDRGKGTIQLIDIDNSENKKNNR